VELESNNIVMKVSIHASTQEATSLQPRSRARTSRFNPRLHAGGDLQQLGYGLNGMVFQSTPPRRRRLRVLGMVLIFITVSIHASTQEAT